MPEWLLLYNPSSSAGSRTWRRVRRIISARGYSEVARLNCVALGDLSSVQSVPERLVVLGGGRHHQCSGTMAPRAGRSLPPGHRAGGNGKQPRARAHSATGDARRSRGRFQRNWASASRWNPLSRWRGPGPGGDPDSGPRFSGRGRGAIRSAAATLGVSSPREAGRALRLPAARVSGSRHAEAP